MSAPNKRVSVVARLTANGVPLGKGDGAIAHKMQDWGPGAQLVLKIWAALTTEKEMLYEQGNSYGKVTVANLQTVVDMEGRPDRRRDSERNRYSRLETVGGCTTILFPETPQGGLFPDGSVRRPGKGLEASYKPCSVYGFFRNLVSRAEYKEEVAYFQKPKFCVTAKPTDIGARWLCVQGKWISVKPIDWPVSILQSEKTGEDLIPHHRAAMDVANDHKYVYVGYPVATQEREPWELITQIIYVNDDDDVNIWEAIDMEAPNSTFVEEGYPEMDVVEAPTFSDTFEEEEVVGLDDYSTAAEKDGRV